MHESPWPKSSSCIDKGSKAGNWTENESNYSKKLPPTSSPLAWLGAGEVIRIWDTQLEAPGTAAIFWQDSSLPLDHSR